MDQAQLMAELNKMWYMLSDTEKDKTGYKYIQHTARIIFFLKATYIQAGKPNKKKWQETSFYKCTDRLLIFDNRVEIISPGCLPDGLTVESIKLGSSTQSFQNFCAKTMPYRGLGSGLYVHFKKNRI